MLEVIIENESLDLEAEAGISITATNPMLDKDSIGRAFSFPFSLPITPRNARLLGHRQRLDASRQAAKQTGRIRFQGHDVLVGDITEKKSSAARMEVAYSNEVLDIWKKLGEFKISEILDTLTIASSGIPTAEWVFSLGSAPNTYSISIPEGTATATAATPGDVDTAGFSLATQLNALVSGIATYSPGGTLDLASALVNSHPVSTLVSLTLVSVVTVGERNFQNVARYVEDVNDTPIDELCFPLINWYKLYPGGKNIWFNGFANCAVDGVFTPNTKRGEEAWENTVIPCVRVPYILEKIRERLGYPEWLGDVWALADFQQLIVVNNYTLDEVQHDRYADDDLYYLNGFRQSINLNQHVPELTAADFVRGICRTFNVYFGIVDGTVAFLKKSAQLRQSPLDLSPALAPDYSIERVADTGWTLRYATSNDVYVSAPGQLTPIVSGSGKVVSEVVPTLKFIASTTIISGSGNAKLPTTEQPGVNDVYEGSKGRTSMPLTFLFYRGLHNTSAAKPYAYATHDTTNFAGTSVGTYSLDISGAAGLYQQWHKGHIELSDADTLNLTMRLTLGELQTLLQFRNARIRVVHPDGALVGVVKSLSFAARKRGLSEVKIEVLRQ